MHSGSNPAAANEIAAVLAQDSVHQRNLQRTRLVTSQFRAIHTLESYFITIIMLLHHKSQTKGDDGKKDKGVLQHLQSKKFVEFRYFSIDVMKVLSDLNKSFQRYQFCITNLLVCLEAGISQFDALRPQRGRRYQDGALQCGTKKNPKLKLTKTGTIVEDGFFSSILGLHESYSLFAVCDSREMPQD